MFNVDFLNRLRGAEVVEPAFLIPRGGWPLEVGTGTGGQALELGGMGFDVVAIDLPSNEYSDLRKFPVIDYDGRRIPSLRPSCRSATEPRKESLSCGLLHRGWWRKTLQETALKSSRIGRPGSSTRPLAPWGTSAL